MKVHLRKRKLRNSIKIIKKKKPFTPERFFKSIIEKRVEFYGRFLKMIDDLQTPKYKTNQKNTEVILPFMR